MFLQSFPLLLEGVWKELRYLNRSTLSTNNVNVSNEWKSRCHLHDHGGLSSSQGHNERPVEQLNKVELAAMAIGIDEEAGKNWKV